MASEEEWSNWEARALSALAQGVREARKFRGMSQADLADSAGLSKGAIMNIESVKPRVRGLPSIATVIRLAAALEVPPVALLYPGVPDGETELLPGIAAPAIKAVQWFCGEEILPGGDRVTRERRYAGLELISLARQLDALRQELLVAERNLLVLRVGKEITQGGRSERITAQDRASARRIVEAVRDECAMVTERIRALQGIVADE
ncbi:helix-turn-helix domain-containing protein [Rhodococcus pyridinivorans]|uniref:helix-turn-helix transcriptional regulator n=1 Tax=Rhodococcus pyridinivorans TaxID=103816 RepID=UPI001E288864|nr:helix-turn-helix transcriptional regulator [Rhodococcus pyridinivorans]UGQ58977.1 helix-turn-helix domain-containing protein [Rhodococcus pyridinivorans]